MPIAAKIQHRIGLFDDWNHMRIIIKGFHKRVNVHFTESAGKRRLSLGNERLIPKNQHTVVKPRPPDILDRGIRQWLR